MIPKILHAIWLTKAAPSERLLQCRLSWLFHLPDWEIKLWTPDNLPPMKNRELFEAAEYPGEAADILRLEVLAREGGVYFDTDVTLLRPLDRTITDCDAFLSTMKGHIHNAILGCAPGNPFFGYLVDGLPSWVAEKREFWSGREPMWRRAMCKTGSVYIQEQHRTWEGEPPALFSDKVFRHEHVYYQAPPPEGLYAIHRFGD